MDKEREDRIMASQQERQRRLEAKNAEIFLQTQSDVTRVWGKWFWAVTLCDQLELRFQRRRKQWSWVFGVVFILRHFRRWRAYFVTKRLSLKTRMHIGRSLQKYAREMRARGQTESSGLVLNFLQLALNLGDFTKKVKAFLVKIVQVQHWIRAVLRRISFGLHCVSSKWKRKLRERRSEVLKDIIISKPDRSLIISYRDVLLRYENIFGNKLWPLLRKVRKKNWRDLKTQYCGKGKFHEMRQAQTWLLGSEDHEEDTELFAVGAYVCTYDGLLTNASFEKWERTVYLSFLAYLKTEMRTGHLAMGDEALEQLAVKTIKTNGGTEHFVNPELVHTSADFHAAMKVLGEY